MDWHPFAMKFPLLTGDDWESFLASIKRTKGNSVPVAYRMVEKEKQGLDGRNRMKACDELGLKCKMEKVDISDDEAKEFILDRNVHRRHMTRELRQEIVAELRADGKSVREIASSVGVSPATVHADLSTPGVQNRTPETVTGLDGKTYPAVKGCPLCGGKKVIPSGPNEDDEMIACPKCCAVPADPPQPSAPKLLCRPCRTRGAKPGCKECAKLNKPKSETPEREPGDDTEVIKADKKANRKATKENGQPIWDDKAFDDLFGRLLRFFDDRQRALGKHAEHAKCREGLDIVLKSFRRWKGVAK